MDIYSSYLNCILKKINYLRSITDETINQLPLTMKKIFTLIVITSVPTSFLLAQATPNAGFESWTHTSSITGSYDTPDNWNTPNSQTAITGVVSCQKGTSAHGGSFALELITKQIPAPFSQLVPGFATTGTIPSSITGSVTGGIAYTLRPDSITGWYKYSPQAAETGLIQFLLFGAAANNSDTVATANFTTPSVAVGSYTRFSVPLVYRNTDAVANSMWLIASSKNDGLAGSVGSTLYVDDLALVINPSAAVSEQNMPELIVGPNPAADHLEIKNPLNAKAVFVLYDVNGRKVIEEKIENASTLIGVNTLPNGLYSYSLTDSDHKAIKGGKLIIKK